MRKGEIMSWVYRIEEHHENQFKYVVGDFSPTGEWHAIGTHTKEMVAKKWVHYLNGGSTIEIVSIDKD